MRPTRRPEHRGGGRGLTELSGTWKITARGHHAVYAGRLVVSVEHRNMTAIVAPMLGRLRKEEVDNGQGDS